MLDPVFLVRAGCDATPREHGTSCDTPYLLLLFPTNDVVRRNAEVAGDLGTALARGLDQSYGLLLEFSGVLLLGGGHICLQSESD